MKIFEYSIAVKFFYRYINFLITVFLFIYAIISLFVSFQKWYFIFIALFNFLIIYLLNRFYYNSYKLFPFKVEIADNKIICSKYFFSKKIVSINFEDIEEIKGGIFSGMPMRPVYIFDYKNKNTIGFYSHVSKFNELLKIILQNVREDIYKAQLEKLKKISI